MKLTYLYVCIKKSPKLFLIKVSFWELLYKKHKKLIRFSHKIALENLKTPIDRGGAWEMSGHDPGPGAGLSLHSRPTTRITAC